MCEQLPELDYTLNVCYPSYAHTAEIFDRHGLLTEKVRQIASTQPSSLSLLAMLTRLLPGCNKVATSL